MGATTPGHTSDASDNDVPTLVTRLLELTDGLLPEQARDTLRAGLRRLDEGHFYVVVVGEFKRGKSSLVNALLGREVLPTGVVPMTSAVIVIRSGTEDRLLVGFGGEEHERPPAELATYATEEGNPENVLGVTSIVVELDTEILAGGLCLIDTPGLGSTHSHNSETTMEFVPRADAALVVLAADQPLAMSEREMVARTGEFAPRLIFALNRIDLLGEEEIATSRRFVLNGLTDEGRRGGADIFCLSARSGDGVPALAKHLKEVGQESGRELTVASVRSAAGRLAREASRLARLEREALELPLAELERRRELFEQRVGELLATGAESADLLEAGTRRMLDTEVVPLPRRLREDLGPRLADELEQRAGERPELGPRQLAGELRRWGDERLREEFTTLAQAVETRVAASVAELERRHAGRVERLLEDLEIGEALDPSLIVEHLRATGLREPSHFGFKLEDPEHALEALVRRGRASVPGGLGRRLVRAEARTRILAMVDRHAGRLRSELDQRTRSAVAAYAEDLAAAVAEAAGEIAAAAERARTERGEGARGAEAYLSRLGDTRTRLDRIADQIDFIATRRAKS